MTQKDIYSFVKAEENRFLTERIQVGDNWEWNFREHVQLLFHLKNSVFFTGSNEWKTLLRAFRNIMEPILNLAYWSEDIELKDVVFYIKSARGRVLSFLIKKYHDEVYVKEHDLDTLFDEITESDVDYGGVLVQKAKGRPEVIQLNTIAFCDQTDVLGGPLGFKFNMSPSSLRKMSSRGWGNKENGATVSIEELIAIANSQKAPDGTIQTKKNETTGKNIEVYIVRGDLPDSFLNDGGKAEEHYSQVHVIAFYRTEKGEKKGCTLYRKKEVESTVKFHTSKKVHNRALGRGIGESLIHPQIWTNYLEIHKMQMLEAASKVPLYTDDESFGTRNKIQDMENLEITTVADGKRIFQVPTAAAANIQLFERSIDTFFQHAQLVGSAFDPLLGKEQVSGTTFRGQERTVAQGRGLHDRRRGQRAKFIEQLYREWIIPDIKKEVVQGKEFLATLTSEEMQWVGDQLAENYAIREQYEAMFNAKIPRDKDELKQEFKERFSKSGSKALIKILRDEFRDIEVRIGINVASKQKDLVGLTDKILSIFQFVFQNPQAFQQAMQIPALSRAFQDILEYSGINSTDFTSLMAQTSLQTPAVAPSEQIAKQLALAPTANSDDV